jgi:lysophospholipase L1-like esterase
VPGSQVTAIGDSVMLSAAVQLQSALPGIVIDAQVSRQVSVGLSRVQQLAADGALRPIVVFALGTNGTFAASQMRALIATIGPHRKLVLVNTYEARSWQSGDNQVIAAAAHRHANVVLANWFATIKHRTGLLWSDGVHPQPAGARLYAHVVAAAVQAAGAARPARDSQPPPPRPIRPIP